MIMNEQIIEKLQRHLEFARSFYEIAGDWGDIPYGKLNALVEYFEDELTILGIDKYEERERRQKLGGPHV